nr:MAG TPA: hypothetical protein [Bacteriophage sp.]
MCVVILQFTNTVIPRVVAFQLFVNYSEKLGFANSCKGITRIVLKQFDFHTMTTKRNGKHFMFPCLQEKDGEGV